MPETTEQGEFSSPSALIEELLPADVLDVWHIMCYGHKYSDPKVRKYISKIRKSPFYQCWVAKIFCNVVSFLIYKLDHSRKTFIATYFGVHKEYEGYRLDCLLDKSLITIFRKGSSYDMMVVEVKKDDPLLEVFFKKGFQECPLAQQFYEEYSDDNLYLLIEKKF